MKGKIGENMSEIKPVAHVYNITENYRGGLELHIEELEDCLKIGDLLYLESDYQTLQAENEKLKEENIDLQKQIVWLSTPYLNFLNKWCTEYEDLKNDFELCDEWAHQKYDETGLRIKRAYTRFKQVMKSRRLECSKLIKENEEQAKRIAELEAGYKLLQNSTDTEMGDGDLARQLVDKFLSEQKGTK